MLYFGYYFPSYNQPAEDKIFDIIAFYNYGISWSENLYEWIAEILVILPFLIFSVKLLNKYHAKIKNNFSDISKISYTVIRNLIIICIALYFIEVLVIIFAYLDDKVAILLNPFLYVFEIIIVYVIGYDALVRQKNETTQYVYIQEPHNSNISAIEKAGEIKEYQKYEKNILSEIRIKEITQKTSNCIDKEKPYLNSELRLNDFSKLIGEHPNNVSQVLNDVFQKNFYDFINYFRIEDAKKLLKSNDFKSYTITAIGFEIGFNSKSTFYSAFKKNTGVTPAQFQKTEVAE